MKRMLAAAAGFGVVLIAASPAHADWSVGVGGEHLNWRETTTPGVKETGLRMALDLTWSQTRAPGISAAYNAKFYVGNVDYRGALMNGTPISTDSHYRGLAHEFQALYRTAQSPVDFVAAVGWDSWRRRLSSIQRENFDVLYARLGVASNAQVTQGAIGSLGIKYPLWVSENANLTSIGFDQNPRIRPGREVSFYGSLGYRFNPSWDVLAYYDSYRFSQSDAVNVTAAGVPGTVWQPESRMDVIGVKLQRNF
jgi:hypothetical protein